MKTPRTLPELLQAFQERHRWWTLVTMGAQENHADRQNEAQQAATKLNHAETVATGLQRVFDRLQRNGLGGTQPDLKALYKKHAQYEATILKPLDGLDMSGAVSQNNSKFWQKYGELLAEKDFTAAERHLMKATNWWQRTKVTLAGGGHYAFKEWEDEIEGAKKHLTGYKTACDNIDRLEDTIGDAHEAMGDALYKILNDTKVQRMLALPATAQLAQQHPELSFLTHYAGRTMVPRDEIIGRLESMRGQFRLEKLMHAVGEMAQKTPAAVDRLRQEASVASAREQAAHQFLESVNATKRMELHKSYIVNGLNPAMSMSRDLFSDLQNTAHMPPDEIQNLVEIAQAKMKRWVHWKPVEENVKLMKQPDFDPKDLHMMPWNGYVVNAGLQSTKRAVWDLPVKALSATAAFIGTKLKQAWDHARDHLAPGQPPPLPLAPPPLPQSPLQQSPQQQQQPYKPPSLTL